MSDKPSVFPYRQILRAGLSRGAVRHGLDHRAMVRVSRGVYAGRPAGEVQRLRALLARLPAGTVFGYDTAARLYGFAPEPGRADNAVHVVVPPGIVRPRISGVVCHEAALPVPDPVVASGLPWVPPARCAIDLARRADRLYALSTLDAALRSGYCTPAELAEEVGRQAGRRGVRQVRELVPLADGRAECAQESHLRLIIIDGGLPAPEPQLRVYDTNGNPCWRLDLGYRERRLGMEYDGRSHLTWERLAADRRRMNWLSSHGWAMRYFTAGDIYRFPARVVAVVRGAL